MADETPAANPHRGEISITLGGSSYVLLPSFEAVVAIDQQLGGILAVTRRALADGATLTLDEMAVVITEGIRAKGREQKTSDAHAGTEKVKRMIFEAGYPVAIPPVVQFLTAAALGGSTPDPAPSAEGKG